MFTCVGCVGWTKQDDFDSVTSFISVGEQKHQDKYSDAGGTR